MVVVTAGDNFSEFKVKKGDQGTVVDTADGGKYRRFKLVHVSSTSKDKAAPLAADVEVSAVVTFETAAAIPHIAKVTLASAEFESGDKMPAKVWKQLGGTADKLVCQIGFERLVGANGYKIGTNVFVSQPVFEGSDANPYGV